MIPQYGPNRYKATIDKNILLHSSTPYLLNITDISVSMSQGSEAQMQVDIGINRFEAWHFASQPIAFSGEISLGLVVHNDNSLSYRPIVEYEYKRINAFEYKTRRNISSVVLVPVDGEQYEKYAVKEKSEADEIVSLIGMGIMNQMDKNMLFNEANKAILSACNSWLIPAQKEVERLLFEIEYREKLVG